jgi:streptogramin lyase
VRSVSFSNRSPRSVVWLVALCLPVFGPALARAAIGDAVTWTGANTPAGHFTAVGAVATNASGDVFVIDGDQILRFSRDGTFLAGWGGTGSEVGQLNGPADLAADAAGNVFVTDRFNNRVVKYSDAGAVLAVWTGSDAPLREPRGIAVDVAGNVYVGEQQGVRKLSSEGGTLAQWTLPSPGSIAIGPDQAIYLSQSSAEEVWKLAPDGRVIARFGCCGDSSKLGAFGRGPWGVTTARDGTIWVADPYNRRIQQFSSSGHFLSACGAPQLRTFRAPGDVAAGPDGTVLVADVVNVQRLTDTARPARPCDNAPPVLRRLKGTATHVRGTPGGVRVSLEFTLEEPVALHIIVFRIRSGQRAGSRCVPVKTVGHGSPCRRYVRLFGKVRSARRGNNKLRLPVARLDRGRGARIAVSVVARDRAGNASSAQRLLLRVH